MPQYIFENPNNGEIVEVFQKMNDKHIFEKDGVKYKRLFTKPNYSIDSVKIDPFSSKDYVKATDKKGTIGDMMERSAELSEKRKEKDGKDTIKESYFREYKNKRRGKEHPEQKREKLKEATKDIADIEF